MGKSGAEVETGRPGGSGRLAQEVVSIVRLRDAGAPAPGVALEGLKAAGRPVLGVPKNESHSDFREIEWESFNGH